MIKRGCEYATCVFRASRKRGMTASTVIGLILAVSALAILVVVYFTVYGNFNNYTKDEICHQSIITRATVPAGASYVPLKCATKKICLTTDKDCSEFATEKKPTKIKISDDKTKTEVEAEIVNAMYDCWKMTGEGKLSLFSSAAKETGLDPDKVTCIICSRIAFNVSNEILNQIDINTYMKNTQVPKSSLTYLQTFTDRSVNSYAPINDSILKKWADSKSTDITFQKDTKELAIVFSQIKTKKPGDVLSTIAGLGATAAGTAFAIPFIPKGYALATVGLATAGVGVYSYINVKQGQSAAIGYCGPMSSNSEKAREGCSMIQIVPYEPSAINKICQKIEGSP